MFYHIFEGFSTLMLCPVFGDIIVHACDYLGNVANAIYEQDTEQSAKCSKCMQLNLRKSGGDQVLKALYELSESHSSRELNEAIVYFQNNVSRMDYPSYEALGYHITSSTVESACRHVVGDRLKRSGMRWTIQGA